jgi:hypothetical protein
MKMKIICKYFVGIAMGLLFSTAYAIQMWSLVGQQINGGTWYCTYQLMGSNPPIVQTITSSVGCQASIMR